MIISTNWLKQFTDIDVSIDALATLIGARLVEIEEVIDLGPKYKDVIVAKVVECNKLEGSDHLNVTKIDDGGKAVDVERDENGLVQVVCGAPNVYAGMLVAWLPPNSIVPETYNDTEPFVLGARKLRGAMSNGMLASAKELDLGDSHDGIAEISIYNAQPGDSFAALYELNDYLLDIENKSLTHRPDCFGVIGFAREVAAIQGKAFHSPSVLQDVEGRIDVANTQIDTPTISIDSPDLSARYQAIVLQQGSDEAVSSSALSLMSTWIARVGVRPISPIVDVTNFLMLLTGQPLHAFDYDKLIALHDGKAEIHVRAGRLNETMQLLDGRMIELNESDIVIANGETPVALAGAMGGASTAIDSQTTRVILESATFNLYNLRSTQMRHGIFSEAITRFTKGQPAELTAPVLKEAVGLLEGFAQLLPISDVADCYPNKRQIEPIKVQQQTMINDLLGSDFSMSQITETLQNVEFHVDVEAPYIVVVTPPYWRADIHIVEDVVEEVGRLNGFDTIEPTLPLRDFTAVRPTSFDELRARVRKTLVRAGANEVLTYSFIHGDVLQKAGQDIANSYRITNSISPDLQYYRQTLTPSLLGSVYPNVKQGYDSFAIFEMNKTHPKQHGLTDENVPTEVDMLALTFTNKKAQKGSAYYQAKKLLDYLGASLGLDLMFNPIETDPNLAISAPFEYRRSAVVTDKKTDTYLGIVGEYKKSVMREFKLPEHTAGFEINTAALHQATSQLTSEYTPLSRYPGTERDICYQVANDVSYSQIIDSATMALNDIDLETVITPVDIYQADNSATKNVTVRIKLTAHDRTLTGDEVASIIARVNTSVIAQVRATII